MVLCLCMNILNAVVIIKLLVIRKHEDIKTEESFCVSVVISD